MARRARMLARMSDERDTLPAPQKSLEDTWDEVESPDEARAPNETLAPEAKRSPGAQLSNDILASHELVRNAAEELRSASSQLHEASARMDLAVKRMDVAIKMLEELSGAHQEAIAESAAARDAAKDFARRAEIAADRIERATPMN